MKSRRCIAVVTAQRFENEQRTAQRNGLANVQVRDTNLFDLLHDLDGRGERFDTVILDPPAFAKSKDAVEKAKRGYKEINLRALRLLRDGTPLSLGVKLDLDVGGPYESYNVIGEIPGTTKANEIVLIGAHLDSWDLGDGALDNGANVAMLIDVARQFQQDSRSIHQ